MTGDSNPFYKPRIECICAGCGKTFTKYPSRTKEAKGSGSDFCSKHCSVYHRVSTGERTDIEILMADLLRNNAVPFREQVPMYDKWVVDFVVDGWNLIIFCDGVYWHSKPKVAGKDRGQTAYLRKCGWNVLRFTDPEIKDSPAMCLGRILAYGSPAVAREKTVVGGRSKTWTVNQLAFMDLFADSEDSARLPTASDDCVSGTQSFDSNRDNPSPGRS